MADPTTHPRQAIREEHRADLGKALGEAIGGIGLFLLGLSALILMLWLVFSVQKTQLYEADNVVCASQPFSLQCFERKPR